MAGVKLVVIYPRPKDIEVFEKLYQEEHVPMAVDKLAGKTKFIATKVVATPDGTPLRSTESPRSISRPWRHCKRVRRRSHAFHPQTILAHSLNDVPLPVGHGAPLRLRVERQLGYKHAKYVMRIELTDQLGRFGRGNGGFWEDRGYEWYAGI